MIIPKIIKSLVLFKYKKKKKVLKLNNILVAILDQQKNI